MKVHHIILFLFTLVFGFGCASRKPQVSAVSPPGATANLGVEADTPVGHVMPKLVSDGQIVDPKQAEREAREQRRSSRSLQDGHIYGPNQYDGWVGFGYPGGSRGSGYRGSYGSGLYGGSSVFQPNPRRTGVDYYYLSAPYNSSVHIQGGGLHDLFGGHKKK